MRLYRHLQRPDCRLTLVSPDIFYIKKQNMRAKFRCACGWEGFKFVKDVLHDEQIECRTCSAKRRALNPTVKQMRHQRRFAVMQTTSTAHVYDILNCGPRNRFVANGKLVHNSGGDKINPQNLPRGGVLREAIQAPEGYRLVACDSSNIEARVLAWFAGQADLVQEFRDGADVYSSFASKIYGRPINKHNDPNERHVGKTCVLGLGYAVGANKLQHALETGLVKIKLPLEECQRIVGIYRGSFTAISQLWKECQVAIEAMYKGYDTTVGHGIQLRVWGKERAVEFPNGMKLQYPDLQQIIGDKGWAEYTYQKKRFRSRIYGGALTENLVQGLARIIVAYQMCAIKQELDKVAQRRQDGKIRQVVHMVHDEVIVVVPEEEAEDVKRMMERVMSTPPKWAPDLPVNCEAGVGRTYVEAK